MKHNTMIVNVRNIIRAGYAIHRIGFRIFSFFVCVLCYSYKNGLNYSFFFADGFKFSVYVVEIRQGKALIRV